MRTSTAIFLWLLLATSAMAAPKAAPWARWQPHDDSSTATIDNSALNDFLGQYVVKNNDGPNGVRYDAVSKADHKKLKLYIGELEKIDIAKYNRHVQRAYWTNLYNAETLDLVINAYPVDSIKSVDGGFFNRGPWDKKVLNVDGVKLSLNDIEHRILRPFWPDGMTHYGVNCASISCPSLADRAYTGATVDKMLRNNAAAYVNSTQGVSIVDRTVTVSSIYDWYQADFGGNTAGVLGHLQRLATPELSARLRSLSQISGYTYDWRLNSEDNISKLVGP